MKPDSNIISNKSFPYKAELMQEDDCIWWPVSSNEDDNMVIGDGIPGDMESAKLCARCCNIAYMDAIKDVIKVFKEKGMDVSNILKPLTKGLY